MSYVYNQSCLQLINTSIDTFFSKLCAILVEQRRRKGMIVKMKQGGAVDEFSAD